MNTSNPPRVFISYSWDNDGHKDWVRYLAEKLRDSGVDARLDQWHLRPGESVTLFMEQEAVHADFVLVVCTTEYAKKSNERKGGVGYEQQIISGQMLQAISPSKFIPALRAGSHQVGHDCAIPIHFTGIAWIDFKSDSNFKKSLETLLRTIFSKPEFTPPPLGCQPSFQTISSTTLAQPDETANCSSEGQNEHTDEGDPIEANYETKQVDWDIVESTENRLWRYVRQELVKRIPYLRRWWTKRYWKLRNKEKVLTNYITKFLNTNRCPSWDANMCDPERISSSRIRYIEMGSSCPPGFLQNIEDTERITKREHTASIYTFMQYIYQCMAGARGHQRNVFVILANPGAGKSALAVQLAKLMAEYTRVEKYSLIPVYVNLKHFKDRTPTVESLHNLVDQFIALSCPRYLPKSKVDNIDKQLLSAFRQAESRGRIFYIFDSMDEMPTALLNQRLQSIAEFISNRRQLGFLIACRRADYVKLSAYSDNLQIQRIDLMGWSKRMVRDYISSIISNKDHRKQLKRLILSYTKNDDYVNPVLVALLVRSRLAIDSKITISDLWDNFVTEKLRPFCKTDKDIGEIKRTLGLAAYDFTWPGIQREEPSRSHIETAKKAGLIKIESADVLFEIRPLESYFAGRELVNRAIRDNCIPNEVSFTDPTVTEPLQYACEQGVRLTEWVDLLIDKLSHPCSATIQADNLRFISDCLSGTQSHYPERFDRLIAEKIEKIIDEGDDVDKQICLDAISKRPELLSNKSKIEIVFSTIVWFGDARIVKWLFQVLSTRASLLKRYYQIWIALVIRTLHQCSFAVNVDAVIGAITKRILGNRSSNIARFSFLVIRIVVMYLLLFIAYFIGESTSWLLVNKLLGLSSYPITFFFIELKRQGLLKSIPYFWGDTAEMSLLVLWPWVIMRSLSATNSRFADFRKRSLFLVLSAFTLSSFFPILIWLILHLAFLVKFFGYVMLLVGMVITIIFVALTVSSKKESSVDKSGELTQRAREAQGSFYDPVINNGIIGELPDTSPGQLLFPKDLDEKSTIKASSILTGLMVAGWLIITGVAFVSGGFVAAAFTFMSAIPICILYTQILSPWLDYRQVQKRLHKELQLAFNENLSEAFNYIVSQIRDQSLPTFIRYLYADSLCQVRYNLALYNTIRSVCDSLPHGIVRTRLVEIVAEARNEATRNG